MAAKPNLRSVDRLGTHIRLCLLGLAVLGLSCDSLLGAGLPRGPLLIHGKNPRYFAHKSGKAIILSGSHTWANFQERGVEGHTPEFDYEAYLDFMEGHGHNFMRLWRWEHAQWMRRMIGRNSTDHSRALQSCTSIVIRLFSVSDKARNTKEYKRLQIRVLFEGEGTDFFCVLLRKLFCPQLRNTVTEFQSESALSGLKIVPHPNPLPG